MEELYKENAHIVYCFLLAACHDAALAEDLTQETFVQAIASIGRYDGSCKVSTWLCQIAKHLLYRYWEKHKHEQLGLPEQQTWQSERDTEREAIKKIELADVWERMMELPEMTRRVMTMRVLGDLSYAQIAAAMGKSENWARVTYFRGKQAILRKVENV